MKRDESVWDYPRPPALDPSPETVEVYWAGQRLVFTSRSIRVLETSHPPTYYFHPDDVDSRLLEAVPGTTYCEFKGPASYFDLVLDDRRVKRPVWCYPNPTAGFREIAGWYSLYPRFMDACIVDGEEIIPQEGSYYGGWITPGIRGPFKGGAGTAGW